MTQRTVAVFQNGELVGLPAGDTLQDVAGTAVGGSTSVVTTLRAKYVMIDHQGDLASVPDSIQGNTISPGDVILFVGQTNKEENGLRVAGTVTMGFANFYTRDSSLNTDQEVNGLIHVQVMDGSAEYKDSLWALSSMGGLTIGTSDLNFVRVSRKSDKYAMQKTFYFDGQNQITNAKLSITMEKAGYIVGASIISSAARTAGTINAKPHVQGTEITPTGLNLIIDGTSTLKDSKTVAYLSPGYDFAAGDTVGINLSSTSFAPLTGSVTVHLVVEVPQ